MEFGVKVRHSDGMEQVHSVSGTHAAYHELRAHGVSNEDARLAIKTVESSPGGIIADVKGHACTIELSQARPM